MILPRRVFFSFDYDDDHDISRAHQVRNSKVVAGPDIAGFFDHSEYQEAEEKGMEGIKRLILKHLEGTSATVVLIGTYSASSPWVRYGVEQSVARKNGLLGVYIHHLRDHNEQTSARGPKPTLPWDVVFPAYDWDGDLERFKSEIEAAGKRSDALRGVKLRASGSHR